ncbi:beta-ketoacyl synthase chain length factor [Cochleicola gelatinilyticus]|uniref:Beta-ketoacyl synthase-like N-terminal domain-containing protein n=1 Tax=Cochleicola gelatinilyticus TaxID=1763537 RepID=A0A167JC92_9FLAO|nr:beta-ketoacyl synthase chain length factor [Cochleicola gelatinilyticus]OAB80534.1 hypothetical protein ULVI_07320 [Cochleicola gelatinilyticus]
MKTCFIHSAICISAQETFYNNDFLKEASEVTTEFASAIHPVYKDYIPPAAIRRMAPGVKMGVVAAKQSLNEANINIPEAIIVGTGMGCIEDSEKFLNALIDNDEEFLAPTSFIQSTHNTVGAQIALGLQCKAYNMTYVHGAVSFESGLLDAQLLIQTSEAKTVLVGGVDELGKEFSVFFNKIEKQQPQGIQVPFGEGAGFFGMSSEKAGAFAILKDVQVFETVSVADITSKLKAFLTNNGLLFQDIDAILMGENGDAYDVYYHEMQASVFLKTPQISYKKVSGEFYTASVFGFWAGCHLLKRQEIPKILLKNSIEKKNYQHVLLYNQYKGKEHSFTLLSRC